MGLSITNEEFQMLRDLIEKECGIEVKPEKAYLIENRLTRLVIENGCETFGEFCQKAQQPNPILRAKIVDAITTNETLWFRDETPFYVLRDHLLPAYADQVAAGERSSVRIWSAACSTGQEPYSIAMTICEAARQSSRMTDLKNRISILATDISASVLHLAKTARYDPIAMSRGMLPGLKERYFEEQDRVCVLKDEIKQMVEFRQFNLQSPLSALGKFDIVFLRNVAIYFAYENKIQLFQKIARHLNPEGYLILGSTEILSGYSDEFDQKDFGRSILYQVKPLGKD